tara:strand:+ start:803 stop:1579 length:777 start_codon:yes stop_codon:yes gene_type:complete
MNERIDIALVKLKYAPTRSQARLLIKEGVVFYRGKKVEKPGFLISSDEIEVKKEKAFVGRGGDKLEGVLEHMKLDLKGCLIADVGASTGGFTDVVLRRGAKKVYAIDVGRDQLANDLLKDKRVINYEGINIKNGLMLPEKVDFCVVDLSFISLKLVLEEVFKLLHDEGKALVLVKPQFEAGLDKVGKKGVVKDSSIRLEVLLELFDWCFERKICVENFVPSSVQGKKGNQEYFFLLSMSESGEGKIDRKKLILRYKDL